MTTATIHKAASEAAVGPTPEPTVAERNSGRRLRIAYLAPEYPKPSHTFIRREILELERRGHVVLRLSIRDTSGSVVDSADREEAAKTISCLKQPWWRFLWALCFLLLTRPLRFARAVRMSVQMWRPSERSMLRHAAYLAEAAVLIPLLTRHEIEHLHVHFGTNAATVARLIQCLGGPTYSMTVHGPGEFDGPRSFCLGAKVKDSLFTVAISSFGTSQIQRWVDYEQWDKLHVIRCSVGDDFLPPPVAIDPASRTFVCVGRLTPQKGQLLLLDAARQLIDRGLDLRIVLAGDGELRDVIENRVCQLGLKSTVEVTGWIDEKEVRRRLISARALVLPSFAEGLPVAIMESFASGRPVITTEIAGIPELVVHHQNGWLVTAGDADGLADAMTEALQTPAHKLEELGLSGRQAVRQQHYTETEVDRLEQLLLTYLDS